MKNSIFENAFFCFSSLELFFLAFGWIDHTTLRINTGKYCLNIGFLKQSQLHWKPYLKLKASRLFAKWSAWWVKKISLSSFKIENLIPTRYGFQGVLDQPPIITVCYWDNTSHTFGAAYPDCMKKCQQLKLYKKIFWFI